MAVNWMSIGILCVAVTIVAGMVAVAASVYSARKSKDEHPGEIAYLREEVAQLREEVEQLKTGRSRHGSTDIK